MHMDGLAVWVDESGLSLVGSGELGTRLLSPWDSPGRILEWIAISFSREPSPPRDQTWVSHIGGRFFTV